MPRYEYKEGTSKKFWEISLDGDTFITVQGKIGTDGQEASKSFDTSAEAKKQYVKSIAEKVKKGYELVGGAGDDDEDLDDEDLDDEDEDDEDDDEEE